MDVDLLLYYVLRKSRESERINTIFGGFYACNLNKNEHTNSSPKGSDFDVFMVYWYSLFDCHVESSAHIWLKHVLKFPM